MKLKNVGVVVLAAVVITIAIVRSRASQKQAEAAAAVDPPAPFSNYATQAPGGFKVEQFATGLDNPRLLRTAPNGDVFLAESDSGEIKIFRGITSSGKPEQIEVFATGLRKPFGIAFYPPGPNPQWVYVANTDSVVRFPYQNGDL